MLLHRGAEGPPQNLKRDQTSINSQLFCERFHVDLKEVPRTYGNLPLMFVATDRGEHQILGSGMETLFSPGFDPGLDDLRNRYQRPCSHRSWCRHRPYLPMQYL